MGRTLFPKELKLATKTERRWEFLTSVTPRKVCSFRVHAELRATIRFVFTTRQYLLVNKIRIIRVGVLLLLVVLFNFSKGGVNLGQNAI